MLGGCNDIASEWYVDPNRRAEIHQILLLRSAASTTSFPRSTGTAPASGSGSRRACAWCATQDRRAALLRRDGARGDGDDPPAAAPGALQQDRVGPLRLPLPARRLRPDGTACMPYASIGLLHIFGVPPRRVAEDASVLRSLIHPTTSTPDHRIAHSFQPDADGMAVRVPCLPAGRPEKWVFAHSVPGARSGRVDPVARLHHRHFRAEALGSQDPRARLFRSAHPAAEPHACCTSACGRRSPAAPRPAPRGALLFIDLDNFKMLNDSQGPPRRRPAPVRGRRGVCGPACPTATSWRGSAATSSS